MINVKGILDLCHLQGLVDDPVNDNGWRCETPFKEGADGKKSLCINGSGAWHCHLTNKSGHVSQLYAEVIGKDFKVARVHLIKEGLLERGYELENLKVADKKDEEAVLAPIENLRTDDVDWSEVARWRGLPVDIFKECAANKTFGFLNNYGPMGGCYIFLCISPPIEGVLGEYMGAGLRAASMQIEKRDQWKQIGNYPIWAPYWNSSATIIYLTEGQWDAIALWVALKAYLKPEELAKIQIVALCGGKSLDKYPEIFEFFRGKTVIQIPDRDKSGEDILIRTSKMLEGVDVVHKLLRLPDENGKAPKDFNEWWSRGVSRDDFELWLEGVDDFRVSGPKGKEVVMDSEFRLKHKLKIDSLVEIDSEGSVVEIVSSRVIDIGDNKTDRLLDIISPYPIFKRYMKECLEVSEAPPVWHAANFRVCAMGIAGRRLKLKVGSYGALFPNEYMLLVGSSGMGKGQSMGMLRRIVARVHPGFACGESFSSEGMMDLLAESPQKIIFFEEYSQWIPKTENGYKYSVSKDLTKLYDAHTYSQHNPFSASFRSKGKSVSVSNPIISIVAACVPHQLENMGVDNLVGGLIGRFSFAVGARYHKRVPSPGSISESISDEVEDFFRRIILTPVREEAFCKLSVNANKLYENAFFRHVRACDLRDPTSTMATYDSRWRVRIWKTAMFFETVRQCDKWPMNDSDMLIISEESVLRAIEFVRLLDEGYHLLLKGQFGDEDTTSRDVKIREKILKYIQSNLEVGIGGVSRKNLLRNIRYSKNVLDPIIETIIESGVLVEKQVRVNKNFNKNSTYYLLVKQNDETTSETHLLGDNPINPGVDGGGDS